MATQRFVLQILGTQKKDISKYLFVSLLQLLLKTGAVTRTVEKILQIQTPPTPTPHLQSHVTWSKTYAWNVRWHSKVEILPSIRPRHRHTRQMKAKRTSG